MQNTQFKKYTRNLCHLTEGQLRILKEKIQTIENHHSVSKTLESPKENMSCPHCSSEQIVRWGHQSDMQRFRCRACKKTFNSLSNTPLARLRRRGHWWQFCECLVKGYSLRKSAHLCKVNLTTAFRWRHRFLSNHATYYPKLLAGIIEIRICNLPTPRINKHPSDKNKNTSVLFSSDRYKSALNTILSEREKSKILSIIKGHLAKDSLICVDSSSLKSQISSSFQCYNSGDTNPKEVFHTENTREYEESLKAWLSKFRGVSRDYLSNYLSWYRSIDEYNHQIKGKEFLLRAKETGKSINCKRKHKFLEHKLLNPPPKTPSNDIKHPPTS
ncbi:MAG: IS1 family transposase [Bacteroidales bacterium]